MKDRFQQPAVPWRMRFHNLRAQVPLYPLALILFFTGLAVFAPLVTSHDPIRGTLSDRLRPPFWSDGGSFDYPLGTDGVGRDLWSRIAFGGRSSLIVGFVSLAAGAGIGSAVGIVAGYAGGRIDAFLMRLADIAIGFPVILFALLLSVAVGPSILNVVLAVSFMLWARFAQIVRAEVLSIRDRDYVKLAVIAGCSTPRILFRHILPNVANTIIVLASLQLGWAIIVESSLSFLGAGIPGPTPAWGSMVAEGRQYVLDAYWVPIVPGAAIALVVLGFNLTGDWMRDRLDPKLRSL